MHDCPLTINATKNSIRLTVGEERTTIGTQKYMMEYLPHRVESYFQIYFQHCQGPFASVHHRKLCEGSKYIKTFKSNLQKLY